MLPVQRHAGLSLDRMAVAEKMEREILPQAREGRLRQPEPQHEGAGAADQAVPCQWRAQEPHAAKGFLRAAAASGADALALLRTQEGERLKREPLGAKHTARAPTAAGGGQARLDAAHATKAFEPAQKEVLREPPQEPRAMAPMLPRPQAGMGPGSGISAAYGPQRTRASRRPGRRAPNHLIGSVRWKRLPGPSVFRRS